MASPQGQPQLANILSATISMLGIQVNTGNSEEAQGASNIHRQDASKFDMLNPDSMKLLEELVFEKYNHTPSCLV